MVDPATDRTRFRSARAVAAGLAVVGIGAVSTLALWSDAEFSRGSFASTGQFAVESANSLSGPFLPHAGADDALELDFSGTELEQGDTVTAEIWLRMRSESAGDLTIKAPNTNGTDLDSYISATVTAGACGTGGELLQSGTLAGLADISNALVIPAGVGEEPGPPQPLCFTATVGDTSELPPGEYTTGRIVWELPVAEIVESSA